MVVESSHGVWPEDISVIKSKLDLSDENLWELIENDNRKYDRKRGVKNRDKFLQKVRRYLDSIDKSEGFEATDFPSRIEGLTVVRAIIASIPVDHYFIPECFNYFNRLGRYALNAYCTQTETKLRFMRIMKVNSLSLNGSRIYYYITFIATEPEEFDEITFQAKVLVKALQWEVLFCRLKTDNSSSGVC